MMMMQPVLAFPRRLLAFTFSNAMLAITLATIVGIQPARAELHDSCMKVAKQVIREGAEGSPGFQWLYEGLRNNTEEAREKLRQWQGGATEAQLDELVRYARSLQAAGATRGPAFAIPDFDQRRPSVPRYRYTPSDPAERAPRTYAPVTESVGRVPIFKEAPSNHYDGVWRVPIFKEAPLRPLQPLDLNRIKNPQAGLSSSSSPYAWPQDGQAIKMHLVFRSGDRLDVKADNGVRFPLWHFLDETPELDQDQWQLLKYPWVISTEFYQRPEDMKRLLLALRGLPVSFALTTQFSEGRALERYRSHRDWQQFNVLTDGNSLRKVTKHGEIALNLVNGLSAGSPGGKTLKFLVWHQGNDSAEVLTGWLKRAWAGEFRDQHLAVIGCPLGLIQFIELQHGAIANGALSCTIPTKEVDLPAAALAAVMLSKHPELLDGASPLEALRRGYQAAAVPLAEALSITDDGQAIERLNAAFGERGVDFFRRGNGSLDRATARAILEGLRGDPAQFIECVDVKKFSNPDSGPIRFNPVVKYS